MDEIMHDLGRLESVDEANHEDVTADFFRMNLTTASLTDPEIQSKPKDWSEMRECNVQYEIFIKQGYRNA